MTVTVYAQCLNCNCDFQTDDEGVIGLPISCPECGSHDLHVYGQAHYAGQRVSTLDLLDDAYGSDLMNRLREQRRRRYRRWPDVTCEGSVGIIETGS